MFAICTIAALYHFTNGRNWEIASEGLKKYGHTTTTKPAEAQVTPTKTQALASSILKPIEGITVSATKSPAVQSTTSSYSQTASPQASQSRASTAGTFPPTASSATSSGIPSLSSSSVTNTTTPVAKVAPGKKPNEYSEGGQGRHEPPPPLKSVPAIHWVRMDDHFPVPSASMIQLPTGRPSALPKIQHVFKEESPSARIERERKLAVIKEAFQFSWTAYKRPGSWLQDEISPVSGKSRNPFCGWAATLVDALDTLWIMDLQDDFQQAVLAVGEIDFTTSIRGDIPVFETTIRYLGGLMSAYELSGQKYKVLINKAVELADVLMGAFDTPNRMPIMYYYWKPTFASQPHRADTRVTLAEIGSLSMEFTKLAQITKEAKYYDVIARITNEFEIWQNNTKIPGLWPKFVDASGCRKSEQGSVAQMQHALMESGPGRNVIAPAVVADMAKSTTSSHHEEKAATVGVQSPPLVTSTLDDVVGAEATAPTVPEAGLEKTHVRISDSPDDLKVTSNAPGRQASKKTVPKVNYRRQLAMDTLNNSVSEADGLDGSAQQAGKPLKVHQEQASFPKIDCEPQGLASPPGSWIETFTLGAMADSVYEYLPKQYMLLGGLISQYKTMYERAADAATKHLLFRPMIPGDRSILVVGSASATEQAHLPGNMELRPEHQHLLCFVGGMYAIGSKIFDRPEDLDIAAKLTDGCVWAYGATTTGLMPEIFTMTPCENRDKCEWNETRWHEDLDPYRSSRESNEAFALAQKAARETQHASGTTGGSVPTSTKADVEPDAAGMVPTSVMEADQTIHTSGPLAKRQLGNIDNVLPTAILKTSTNAGTNKVDSKAATNNDKAVQKLATELDTNPTIPADMPNPYPSHDEFVQEKIKNERLPKGMTNIVASKYILR